MKDLQHISTPRLDVFEDETTLTRIELEGLLVPTHPPGWPQKALCGGIPGAVVEPLVRFWSHFVGIYRQNLTRSLEN